MLSEYNNRIIDGYYRAKEKTCVIAILARDIQEELQNTIPQMEELGECFRDYRVFAVENDSKDNTFRTLMSWSDKNRKVRPSRYQFDRPRMKDLSVQRIKNMSLYRNTLLNNISNSGYDYDYMIMIDPDVYKIDIDGVMHSISYDDWDAMGSNGRKDLSLHPSHNIYYDVFAHRELDEGVKRNQLHRVFVKIQGKYKDLKKGDPLVRVNSCFNGLAVYKKESIVGCSYHALIGYAEHAGFHLDMIRRGHDKIFINPSQVVYYDENVYKEWND